MSARDVFICHAHFDKASVVRPLAEALAQRGVSCWLDEAVIQPGDSIIDAVSEGLATAEYVVVLLTSVFLKREWTQKELNAALSKEIRTAKPVVIPVLVISASEFAERYPLLADKLYLDWSAGVDSVADGIAGRFDRPTSADWHYRHPAHHVGPVWTRILPREAAAGEMQRAVLRWGPYIRRCEFTAGVSPVSLVHQKTAPDSVTLHVEVDPPANVTFGQGAAPDATTLNIDEGWTRSAGGHWSGDL